MKTISAPLQEHLEGECLTLAHCWKITRRDGVVMGFTDHDHDLEIEALSYQAATGFTPTAIASQSSLAVDNLDVEGMLEAGSITEKDIMAGRYDYAEIEIFLVNYTDLAQGKVGLRIGWLGEVELRNKQFIAEVRGLSQQLSQRIGELYSPVCRARFGDARCAIDREDYTVTGAITAVTSQLIFTDSSRNEADGTYQFGELTFTSGENEGITREVKLFSKSRFTLSLPMPFAVENGDSYSAVRGCDKTFHICANSYSNAVNFRGEPHVPGLDKMLETAGTRSEWE